MNADTMIFRLFHAATMLKGMCGNEPDKRDPSMVRDWAFIEGILTDAEMFIRSTPDDDQTLPCDGCGEDVHIDEYCGHDQQEPPFETEYLCPDCYDPDTTP